MTDKQIEKFAVGYQYPTDYVEVLLKKYDYDTIMVNEILCKPYSEVVKEVQEAQYDLLRKEMEEDKIFDSDIEAAIYIIKRLRQEN